MATLFVLQRSPAVRHGVVVVLSALLIWAFSLVHGQWHPMHRWNRAFGDVALVLLAITMVLGPVSVLLQRFRSALLWRRQFGIWSMLLALVHLVIILDGWVEWDLIRLFGYDFVPQFGRYVLHQHGFGLGNSLGLLALVFGLLLLVTSNDSSVRRLTLPVWQHLHKGAMVFWWLVVAHVAYFLFMHFLDVRRPMLEPNPLQWPFVMLVLGVTGLRIVAFIAVWRRSGI